MTSVAGRLAEVATRTMPGHGEGTRNGSAVGTLVAWTTRPLILARMRGADARHTREGFTTTLRRGPALLRNPLTDDRGTKRVEHERMAQRLAIQIRVADPYRPWQHGTNATTHGRLPQYLPKARGMCPASHNAR